MTPNQGLIVGNLRVLLTLRRTGREPWYSSLAALFFEIDVTERVWELSVSPLHSSVVLARRGFRRKRHASRARNEFAIAVGAGVVNVTDSAHIQAVLDALPTPLDSA